jgi:hypothetical protein
MKEEELVPLIVAFGRLVTEQPACREAFGIL